MSSSHLCWFNNDFIDYFLFREERREDRMIFTGTYKKGVSVSNQGMKDKIP